MLNRSFFLLSRFNKIHLIMKYKLIITYSHMFEKCSLTPSYSTAKNKINFLMLLNITLNKRNCFPLSIKLFTESGKFFNSYELMS